MRRTRIVLADDHPIVLNGLRGLIAADRTLEVVGEAANGTEALAVVRATEPDVAILDLSMPALSGIQVSRRLKEELPQVRVLVLTLHEDRAYLLQCLDAGVRGYVLKRSAAESLVQAIKAVVVGGLYVDPAVANHMFAPTSARGVRTRNADTIELTAREAEVLKLSAQGCTLKEIARRLAIGIKSIETYKARGTAKLDITSRAELLRYASNQGWLQDI